MQVNMIDLTNGNVSLVIETTYYNSNSSQRLVAMYADSKEAIRTCTILQSKLADESKKLQKILRERYNITKYDVIDEYSILKILYIPNTDFKSQTEYEEFKYLVLRLKELLSNSVIYTVADFKIKDNILQRCIHGIENK